MLQQPALAVDAATEAGKLAVRTDDAVTRNDDGDGVLAVGGTDGAGGSQVAQAARDVAVAARHPVGNRAQLLPHPQLERSAARVERQIEAGASAGEVLGELVAGASEYLSPCPSPLRGSGWLHFAARGDVAGSWEIHTRESGLRGREDQLTGGTGNRTEVGGMRCTAL